ncbi:MAG TPA: hypothetical protein VNL77_24515 [Roseiflexaceae bacterium]|nr:hypothetical protein [Roseiflexaceae bacterium]
MAVNGGGGLVGPQGGALQVITGSEMAVTLRGPDLARAVVSGPPWPPHNGSAARHRAAGVQRGRAWGDRR